LNHFSLTTISCGLRRIFKQISSKEKRELFRLSAKFDKLHGEKITPFSQKLMPFSQIQADILTARLLGQLSAHDFVLCNRALNKVSNLPWSDEKKEYVIMNLYSIPFLIGKDFLYIYLREPIDWEGPRNNFGVGG